MNKPFQLHFFYALSGCWWSCLRRCSIISKICDSKTLWAIIQPLRLPFNGALSSHWRIEWGLTPVVWFLHKSDIMLCFLLAGATSGCGSLCYKECGQRRNELRRLLQRGIPRSWDLTVLAAQLSRHRKPVGVDSLILISNNKEKEVIALGFWAFINNKNLSFKFKQFTQ